MDKRPDKWLGAKDFGKILCTDFDGVIAKFDGWQGPNVFGEPIPYASFVLNELKRQGWTIYIFTSRLVTHELVDYLIKHQIPFDDINGRLSKIDGDIVACAYQSYDRYNPFKENPGEWQLNPETASFKPIASVYLDDMNFENEGKNYDALKWLKVLLRLNERFGGKDSTSGDMQPTELPPVYGGPLPD